MCAVIVAVSRGTSSLYECTPFLPREIDSQAGMKMEDMRAMLGRFGLSGHHHLQPICKLSGTLNHISGSRAQG